MAAKTRFWAGGSSSESESEEENESEEEIQNQNNKGKFGMIYESDSGNISSLFSILRFFF